MRRMSWWLSAAGVMAYAWSVTGEPMQAAPRTRIVATFVSHNEESASNAPCRPVMTDRARFLANRAATLAFAQLIVSKGAAYNLQSEWEYLLRVAEWEDAAALTATGGRNVLAYVNELAPGRIEVDAHSHEKRGYNYADVAYLLESLGVPPNGIVGGFTWWPSSSASWLKMQTPLNGVRYAYTWNASILTGAASAGHRMDSNASGIWRPKSATDFHTHDPAQTLINVGNFPGAGDGLSGDSLAGLLDELRAGHLDPGGLYTATFMVPQCELDRDPSVMAAANTLIDRFSGDVASGDLVWMPISQMVRLWQDEYGSMPTIYRP